MAKSTESVKHVHKGKCTESLSPRRVKRKHAHQPLQLVHSDLCGPMNVDSVGGSKYVHTLTDDYARYVTVYFIKSKSEVLSKFMEYVTMMENKTDLRGRAIRTDNGGEYTSQYFKKFFAGKGIAHQLTNLYTPEQNGVSERLNRTLVESTRSMLIHAKMPLKFWAEAVNTAVYLHNRSLASALKDKTPVCKLKKSLYGFKQSARCWNQTLDNFLVTNAIREAPQTSAFM